MRSRQSLRRQADGCWDLRSAAKFPGAEGLGSRCLIQRCHEEPQWNYSTLDQPPGLQARPAIQRQK
jgi:hypothetical protein